jgi:hypothetical protein
MTIRQTLEAIKALPNMTARYSAEFHEFRVRLIGRPDADYFTNYRTDALQTARAMSQANMTTKETN